MGNNRICFLRMALRSLMAVVLILPQLAMTQTVHTDDDRIVYHGKIKLEGLDIAELNARARNALLTLDKNIKSRQETEEDGKLEAVGEVKLCSTPGMSKSFSYKLEIQPGDKGYEYRLDSVKLISREKCGRTTITSSKDLLKNMEVTGPEASRTEAILNEIDMRVQAMLALLERRLRQVNGIQ